MITSSHYVPILSAKEGELGALTDLDGYLKGSSITPLLQVNTEPAEARESFATRVARAWNVPAPILIDSQPLAPSVTARLCGELIAVGVSVVPVIGLGVSSEKLHSAFHTADMSGHGLCLRVCWSEFTSGSIHQKLAAVLRALETTPEEVDLIIDFEDISKRSLNPAIEIFKDVPFLHRWRSLVYAGSSFPKVLSSVIHGEGHLLIPRREWALWQILSRIGLPRRPAYGDYAVNHPDRTPSEVRWSSGANVRYTLDDRFYVARSLRRKGNAASRELSLELTKRTGFRNGFSAGDRWFEECATCIVGVGSATTWRRAGINQHISVVPTQLASWPAP